MTSKNSLLFILSSISILAIISGCAFSKNHKKDSGQNIQRNEEVLPLEKEIGFKFIPKENVLKSYAFEISWKHFHDKNLTISYNDKIDDVDTSRNLSYSIACKDNEPIDMIISNKDFSTHIQDRCPLDQEIFEGQSINLTSSVKFGRVFFHSGTIVGIMQEKISSITIDTLFLSGPINFQVMNPHQSEYSANYIPVLSFNIKNVVNTFSNQPNNLKFQMMGLRGENGRNIDAQNPDVNTSNYEPENGKNGMASPSLFLKIENSTNLIVNTDAMPGAGGQGGKISYPKESSEKSPIRVGNPGLPGKKGQIVIDINR